MVALIRVSVEERWLPLADTSLPRCDGCRLAAMMGPVRQQDEGRDDLDPPRPSRIVHHRICSFVFRPELLESSRHIQGIGFGARTVSSHSPISTILVLS